MSKKQKKPTQGLRPREGNPVVSRVSGRVSRRTPTFTQDADVDRELAEQVGYTNPYGHEHDPEHDPEYEDDVGDDPFVAPHTGGHQYDVNGFDQEGFDRNGYDSHGLDSRGFDYDGFDQEGYGHDGRDAEGFSRADMHVGYHYSAPPGGVRGAVRTSEANGGRAANEANPGPTSGTRRLPGHTEKGRWEFDQTGEDYEHGMLSPARFPTLAALSQAQGLTPRLRLVSSHPRTAYDHAYNDISSPTWRGLPRNRRDLPSNFDDEGYDERGLDVDGFTRAQNVKESQRVEDSFRTTREDLQRRNEEEERIATLQERQRDLETDRDLAEMDAHNQRSRALFHNDREMPEGLRREWDLDPASWWYEREAVLRREAREAREYDAREALGLNPAPFGRVKAPTANSLRIRRDVRPEPVQRPHHNSAPPPSHQLASPFPTNSHRTPQTIANPAAIAASRAREHPLTRRTDPPAQRKRLHEAREMYDGPGYEGPMPNEHNSFANANRIANKTVDKWASHDTTGNAQRLVARHYRPSVRGAVESVSSDDSEKSDRKSRAKIVLLDPVPKTVNEFLHRMTGHPQQKAMQSTKHAAKMEVYAIVRSRNGMHYGVWEQHETVVRYLLGPDAFTAGIPEIRNRVITLQNENPKSYARIDQIVRAMNPIDEATWDFPIEEIEPLHRYYSDLITCFVIWVQRMNAGENPFITVAWSYTILTLNPIHWTAIDKVFDNLKTITWLRERKGWDKWLAFDGDPAWVPQIEPLHLTQPVDRQPRREQPAPQRRPPAPRREALPAPTTALAIMPPAQTGPPGLHHDTRPTTSRAPLQAGQCANCYVIDAGHDGHDCPGTCTRGVCRSLPTHLRKGCTTPAKK